ncbi:DUF4179 domain-containing protein [Brevibacillus sp. HB1.3]|uniref:DUF4179 domain-containing protein n=1 Tax=Brevibacillus sp. HB1.3 TaxID=2738842 RepID=UPI001554AB73|nr:DUF4179 domain-containing protein [Brevibacillus sp. HB1.3]NQF17092.1 DUF4179 domain-containing protein [Brevibacillus sp. HB1.3]
MKKMALCVAALAVVVSTGILVSPSFFTSSPAAVVNAAPSVNTSLFVSQKAGDPGILQAAQNGFTQPLDLKVTDQGFTLEAKEVLADPLRISIIAGVKDKDGRATDVYWDNFHAPTHEYQEITIKDKAGKVLHSSSPNQESWKTNQIGDYILFEHELRSYFDDGNKLPDELVVEFHMKKMGSTKGNWQLSVPVNLKKAKAATKTVAVNQSHTSLQGFQFDLREITFAPSGTEVVIDSNNKDFSYQLVNEKGVVLGAWDSAVAIHDESIQKNVINTMKWRESAPVEKGLRQFHYFHDLKESNGLTFKLHAVYTEEEPGFSVKLDPASVGAKPVTAEKNGTRFTFHKVSKGSGEDRHNIEFEGTLAEGVVGIFPFDTWYVTDEKGKKYSAVCHIEESANQNGRMKVRGNLEIEEMKSLPKQMTITFDSMLKEHRDVSFAVPLLTGK